MENLTTRDPTESIVGLQFIAPLIPGRPGLMEAAMRIRYIGYVKFH